MSVLEELRQMQKEGIPEEEITKRLKEKGVSPKEINDAFNQARIKSAVDDEQEYVPQTPQQGDYTPQTQEAQEEQEYAPQASQQNDYQPEYYGETSFQGTDTNTVIEITEQVFQDRIKTIQKQVETFSEFKNSLQTEVNNLSERLRRIETTIDKLQIAILEKVGAYSEDLTSIRKEMGMMQNSFGKMIENASNAKNYSTNLPSTRVISMPKKPIKRISKK